VVDCWIEVIDHGRCESVSKQDKMFFRARVSNPTANDRMTDNARISGTLLLLLPVLSFVQLLLLFQENVIRILGIHILHERLS
jgi:hypothetical protein